jgi:hypothetical protein
LLPRERVSPGYIASTVSSWVPWWEGNLAIRYNDAGASTLRTSGRGDSAARIAPIVRGEHYLCQ